VNALIMTFLMALLTVLLVTAGGALGGNGGMMIAFIFALIMNGVSYWFSDWKASRRCNHQNPRAK
jgi:heat shock protein HtpX